MPTIFKNPNLPDYFVGCPDVRCGEPAASIVALYEDAKVISLPNLKLDIDHDFWSALPVEAYPHLKKTNAQDDGGVTLSGSMSSAGVPQSIADGLLQQTEHLLDQVRPVYEQLFAGYSFVRRKVCWRLNTIMNEAAHIDAYREPQPAHFARMFINLDTQPRIWKTGFTLQQLYQRFGGEALSRVGPTAPLDRLHAMLNTLAYGRTSAEWWDAMPRHVVYFDPGDVWLVDSRQVTHQIFYGRRAVSIDFLVDPASMLNPRKHYLAMAEDYSGRLIVA